ELEKSQEPVALPAPPAEPEWSLGGLDADAPRLLLRPLRQGDFQHPVDVRRLDGVHVNRLGQREPAHERARGTLDALEAVLRRLLVRVALTLDGQHTLLGGDFQVLALNTRHIGGHDEALGFLANVNVRNPADACAASRITEGTVELPLNTADERPRFVTND